MKAYLLFLAMTLSAGCTTVEMRSAHDCFEDNGVMIFDSFGDVGCMDRHAYALAKEVQPGELITSADANAGNLDIE